MERQFHEAGLSVVGLQETRAHRNYFTKNEHFWRVGSAASAEAGGVPAGGCELWLRVDLQLQDKHITVLHLAPQVLVVRALVGKEAVVFVVGHAPTSDREAGVIRAWRQTLALDLGHVVKATDYVVCMLDANAKVGSVTSHAIGEHCPDQQSIGGQEMHAFLIQFGLALPATFKLHAADHGDGEWTWLSQWGSKHRIDYVALPLEWLPGVSRAAVLESVHVRLSFLGWRAASRQQQLPRQFQLRCRPHSQFA